MDGSGGLLDSTATTSKTDSINRPGTLCGLLKLSGMGVVGATPMGWKVAKCRTVVFGECVIGYNL